MTELQTETAVAVKPLEWAPVSYDPNWFWADGGGYRYGVFLHRSGDWRCTVKMTGTGGEQIGGYDTMFAAKAAAQADFGQRIRSALVPVSAPVAGSDEVDNRCGYCKENGFQHPNLCEDCRAAAEAQLAAPLTAPSPHKP